MEHIQNFADRKVAREYSWQICGKGFNPVSGKPELLYSLMMGLALRANLDELEAIDDECGKHMTRSNPALYSKICKNAALDFSGRARSGNALTEINAHAEETLPYIVSFLPRGIRERAGVEPTDACPHKPLLDRIMGDDYGLFRIMPGDLEGTDVSPDGAGICEYFRSAEFANLVQRSLMSVALDRYVGTISEMPSDHGGFRLGTNLEHALAIGMLASSCMDVGREKDRIRGRSISINMDSSRIAGMLVPKGFENRRACDIGVIGRMSAIPDGVDPASARKVSRFCTEYRVEDGRLLEFDVSAENTKAVARVMGCDSIIVSADEMSELDARMVRRLGPSFRTALSVLEAVDIHLMDDNLSNADMILVPRIMEAYGVPAIEGVMQEWN